MKYILFLLVGLPAVAFSSLFPDPVDDILKAKEVALLIKQLEELERHASQFNKQINGINNLKSEFDKKITESNKLMSGKYNYGSKYMIPGLDRWKGDIKKWGNLAKNYQKHSSDPLNNIIRDVEKTYKITKGTKIFTDDSQKEQADLFDDMSETVIASNAVATQSYNDVDNDLEVLEKLQEEIDKSDSQKKSLDLNARINIQKAKIEAKSNRLKAADAKLKALENQKEITDAKWVSEALDWNKTK